MENKKIKSPEYYTKICLILNAIYWGIYALMPILIIITGSRVWGTVLAINMFFMTIPYAVLFYIFYSKINASKLEYAKYVVKKASHQL